MKDVLDDEIGLALDCGPGSWCPTPFRFAKAVEPAERDVAEDMVTGDYNPFVLATSIGEVYRSTPPHHTGSRSTARELR